MSEVYRLSNQSQKRWRLSISVFKSPDLYLNFYRTILCLLHFSSHLPWLYFADFFPRNRIIGPIATSDLADVAECQVKRYTSAFLYHHKRISVTKLTRQTLGITYQGSWEPSQPVHPDRWRPSPDNNS